MPVYMDHHDVPGGLSPEEVAHIHKQDVAIQDEFGCKALTYWYDDKRNNAFCLIDAPNKKALLSMHQHSHGEIPNKVIEVDPQILESFYGQIEKPHKADDSELHINYDSPSRTILVVTLNMSRPDLITKSVKESLEKFSKNVIGELNQFEGNVVNHRSESFLVAFKSVTNAVSCALYIKTMFEAFTKNNRAANIISNISINTGIPVTDKDGLFESSIKLAEWMCHVVKEQVVVSSEVKNIYQSENLNANIDEQQIKALIPDEELFLKLLMEFIEENWRDQALSVEDFGKNLGYSKSQLYRKMTSLTSKSPNALLKDYRLAQALTSINKRTGNISQIAYECGFNSPAYFTKCFKEKYGILPSDYIKKSESIS